MCITFISHFFPPEEGEEGSQAREGQGRVLLPRRGRPEATPPSRAEPVRGEGAGARAAFKGQVPNGEKQGLLV